MARMLKDPSFKIKKDEQAVNLYSQVSKTHGDRILKYAEQWTLDTTDPSDVERKIEELIWMNTVIYSIGGWSEADGFKADFFL
jgi:GH18 family chitinase